jgi:tripartite-type tricarboxylate transporter receptor subunit TctC
METALNYLRPYIGAALAALAVVTLISVEAKAEAYPTKPLRLIVGVSPGGAVDVVARGIARLLGERLGQPVIVENKTGAGGNLAYEYAAKSPGDGYTLLFASTGIATNVSLYKNLAYDPVRDLTGISLVSKSAHVLVVHPSLGVKTLPEFIALARKEPIPYGSAGNGSVLHLAGEMMNRDAGTKLVHIPYRGGAVAMQDLMAGTIKAMFADISLGLAQVKGGKVLALATTGEKRSSAMPDLPTIAEAGVPGYAISAWFGVMAPSATPPAIVQRLNSEINAVLGDRGLRDRMSGLGQELSGTSADEFSRFVQSEVKKMGDVVRGSAIVLE